MPKVIYLSDKYYLNTESSMKYMNYKTLCLQIEQEVIDPEKKRNSASIDIFCYVRFE